MGNESVWNESMCKDVNMWKRMRYLENCKFEIVNIREYGDIYIEELKISLRTLCKGFQRKRKVNDKGEGLNWEVWGS